MTTSVLHSPLQSPAMSGAIVGGGRDLVFRAKLDLGRRIAGAALAVIGAAIALQLVRAIAANRASTHADWRAYLPVVLVFGAVALAFLLPGTLILLYRREVRVDPENRQVVERQTYLGFGRTRSHALSSFKKIVRSPPDQAPPEREERRQLARSPVLSLLRRGAAVRLAALTRLAVDDEVERERAREAAGLDGADDEAL